MNKLGLSAIVLGTALAGCAPDYEEVDAIGTVNFTNCQTGVGDVYQNSGGEVILEGNSYQIDLNLEGLFYQEDCSYSNYEKHLTVHQFIGNTDCGKMDRISKGAQVLAEGDYYSDNNMLHSSKILQFTPEIKTIWPRTE